MLSEKRKLSKKKWVENNYDKMYKSGRQSNWKRKGIKLTYKEYEKIKEEQNNCCKICRINEAELNFKLCVDHDHGNGQIRGLLCNPCNKLLGNAKENIDILESAMDYLQKVPEKC